MKAPLTVSVVLGCILAGTVAAMAQSAANPSSADKSTAAQPARAKSGGKGKASAPPSGNAFPQAQSEAAARAAQQPAQQATQPQPSDEDAPAPAPPQAPPQAPAPSDGKGQKSSPAADNPFPEAQSQAAASKDSQSGAQTQVQPQPQSSSDGGYSSSSQDLPPSDVGQGQTQRNGSAKEDTYTMDKHPATRIKDDLNVADFYFKNGNYRGAYLRYQDTLKYDPVNETALFGSAMAMCKQNLTPDALHAFRQYLQLYPEGKYTKKAAGMVAHPGKCMHNP
jgi:tetratricopeptide (TPR) repeat protein